MNNADGTSFVDYYDLLGIDPSATMSEIRKAYIQRAKRYHPDAGGSIEKMRLLNTAYKTLKDPAAKRAYDLLHGYQTGQTVPGDYQYSDQGLNSTAYDDDAAVDAFLDGLLAEYRNGPPRDKQTLKDKLKKFF